MYFSIDLCIFISLSPNFLHCLLLFRFFFSFFQIFPIQDKGTFSLFPPLYEAMKFIAIVALLGALLHQLLPSLANWSSEEDISIVQNERRLAGLGFTDTSGLCTCSWSCSCDKTKICNQPTSQPTQLPTSKPTKSPTPSPTTMAPVTLKPTRRPTTTSSPTTAFPTLSPTLGNTAYPTVEPTFP